MVAVSQRLPYPGLRSFRREESDLFFGREDCINAMVDRLAATRFLAVLGSSGTGKSSVVKTGLLDALDLGLMAEAGTVWRVVDLKPGGAPLQNLARRLLETNTDRPEAESAVSDADAALLRAFLVRGPRSVAEWCADGHLPKGTNLLLLVDQFEELFRYQDYAGREEAEAFVALLIESARQRQFPIYVALTMRSEYLGACALIDGLAEAISAGMVLIPRMTREQCRSAIAGPAGVCGFKIQEELTNRLLNDLAAFAPWDDRSTRDQLDRLARRADQLPLLQYCLNRMWMRARDAAGEGPVILTIADYERIGGLGGALNAHADDVLNALGADCRPVAEAVFRALTEGSSAGDAVRRPTRFDELVTICNGDEARARKVVDAFRAQGCNFLAPELDAENPKPLLADTIVDISHESLIRQWKQLSAWVEAEARALRLWRRLRDRFEDGQPLQGAELDNMRVWRAEQKPNPAWARRYGGDFATMMNFIERSEGERRRFAPMMMPLIAVSTLVVCFIIEVGATGLLLGAPVTPWYTDLGTLAACGAITCAVGIWRYAGLGRTRALLAGGTIFVAEWGLGAALIGALISHGYTEDIAGFLMNVILGAPIAATALVLFAPGLRSIFVWITLVGTWVTAMRSVQGISTNAAVQLPVYAVVWSLCFIVLGAHLRWAGTVATNSRRAPALAALKLSALAFATFATAAAWIYAAVEIAFKSVTPWWWWLPVIAVYALTPAITLAYGLRHYRGLDTKSAMSAGLIIFVLEFVAVAAFTAAMLRRGVPLAVASPWGYALLYAPCAMAVLALFERAFRKVTIFLLFSALFAVPDAIVIWLYQHGVSQLGGVIGFLLPHVIALLWIAAIGYWLQRTPGAAGSSRDEVAGGGAAPASTSPYAPGTPNPALSRASA